MSRTGNEGFTPLQIKQKQRSVYKFVTGFTLFEVMVATAVLSLGALFIYEAFFGSLDLFNYCSNHLKAISWVDEKIWQTQDSLGRLGSEAHIQTAGEFVEGNRNFKWYLSHHIIDNKNEEKLYKVDLALSWREGQRQINLKRVAYVIYKEKE